MSRSFSLVWVVVSTVATAQPYGSTERCTRRISQVLGLSWRTNLQGLAGRTPQQAVRGWLENPTATATFGAFINSRFNATPATNLSEDAVYSAVRFILNTKRPWRDLFTGRFKVNHTNGQVTDDPTQLALGYFGSHGWQLRYRGNAPDGLLLSGAYRTLQNTVGFKLIASPINAQGDATATGRERAECRSCHFDSAYALDPVARLLPRRIGTGAGAKVERVPAVAQQLFNGITVRDQEHLLEVLVSSDAFLFNACRLAFEFSYGRKESACEAPIFDRCVDAFAQRGSMHDALASILEDPAYCEATP